MDLDVKASFNLSYSRIPAEMTSVFCKLSIFTSDFDAAAEEAICQDLGHTQLSNLVTWSLVEFEEETGRYHLHDLVGLFAARRLKEGKSSKERSFAAACGTTQNVLSHATELYQHARKTCWPVSGNSTWKDEHRCWLGLDKSEF